MAVLRNWLCGRKGKDREMMELYFTIKVIAGMTGLIVLGVVVVICIIMLIKDKFDK